MGIANGYVHNGEHKTLKQNIQVYDEYECIMIYSAASQEQTPFGTQKSISYKGVFLER